MTLISLSRQCDIHNVLSKGARYHGRLCTLIVKRRLPDECQIRYAIQTRKALGSAVRRNRIRRRLKAIFRMSNHLWNNAIDFILIARPAAMQASFRELETELSSLFNKSERNNPRFFAQ